MPGQDGQAGGSTDQQQRSGDLNKALHEARQTVSSLKQERDQAVQRTQELQQRLAALEALKATS